MTSPTSPAAPSVLDQLPEDQRQFINGWSWGGLFLSWIFLIGMKQTLLGIGLFIVSWIPVVGGLIGLGAAIYLGMKGRAIAWEKRQWRDFEDFRQCMKIWDKWGIIFIAILVGLFILAMLVFGAAMLTGRMTP